METVPSSLPALAVWLTQAVAAAFILSFLAERSTAFQSLSGRARFYVTLGLFVGLPLLGLLLQLGSGAMALPVGFTGWFNAVVPLVVQGFISWVTAQYAHHNDPTRSLKPLTDPDPPHLP